MQRAFYSSEIKDFLQQPKDTILGELARNNPFSLSRTCSEMRGLKKFDSVTFFL